MELPPIMRLGAALPLSMGRCADLYHDIRELRLAMEKEVEEIKARETEIQEHIINTLSVGDDTGAAGLKYRAQVVSKKKPKLAADGWPVFFTWVNKNGFLEMIQRRINEKAVQDWIDDNPDRGIAPGLEMINVKTLSVTKI